MPRVSVLLSTNPFPGLRPFAENEADHFFGRQQQITELVERTAKVNFVAVVGASGCGKSSLVCAGLLSELSRRTTAGNGTEWRSAVMRPGNKPIANLAEKLSPVIGRSSGSQESRIGSIYGQLRLGSLGLVEAVKIARLKPHIRVLVVVDQFEEIFRFKRMIDVDEASAFVKLLLNAAWDPKSPISVIITMRSEFIGSCADFPDLPEAISCGIYLVPKLTREQRKETIVKPVELRGFTIAPLPVQRLLNDVSNSFDDLPVMQHVLARTWNRWAEACEGTRPMNLEDYEAIGTSRQALSHHADQAYKSLPGLEQVVERVFCALTERVSEGVEIRRPLDFDKLCRVVGADKGEVQQVVERFRRPDTAFLMPPPGVPISENPVIDISHESLIRQWQRLQGWTQTETKSRAMLIRLADAARQYEAKEGSLWQGPGLSKALEWQQEIHMNPDWIELYTGSDGASTMESIQRFLALSLEESHREVSRKRFLIGALRAFALLVMVILVGASMVLFVKQKETKSNQLMSRALMELNLDPAVSARLALVAVGMNPNNERAEGALRQSLATLEVAHTEKIIPGEGPVWDPVWDARYSRDGSCLVLASGKTVRIFNSATFAQVGPTVAQSEKVLKAWLVANNTLLVTWTQDGKGAIQRLGDSASLPMPMTCEGDGNHIYNVTVSSDDRHVAAGCYSGDVHVWDLTDLAAAPQSFSQGSVTITALAFTRRNDDVFLASGDADGAVNIWKLGHPDVWMGQEPSGGALIKHETAIRDLSFHKDDPEFLVTASDDSKAAVWRLDLDGQQLASEQNKWELKHERPVLFAKFVDCKDKKTTVMTVSDKRVRLWTGERPNWRQTRRHEDWVNDANVSANGELLATASNDGTAYLWSNRSGSVAILHGHKAEVNRAIFHPYQDQLITASSDGTVRVWRFKAPRLISVSNRWVLSAAFDPGSGRVAIGEEGGCCFGNLENMAGASIPVFQDLKGSPGNQYTDLSWSQDGKHLLSREATQDISQVISPVLWNVERSEVETPEWLARYRKATFIPDTKELITINKNGLIGIWDVKDLELKSGAPQPKHEFGGDSWDRYFVAVSPDGKWIASAEGDKVSLWNRDMVKILSKGTLQGHRGTIMSLQFSSDNTQLVTSSQDMTARIWQLDPSVSPKVLRGHTASLFSAAFHPNGKFVVTGSADGTIRVWDAESGDEHAALRWHNEGVNQVHFSPKDNSILSASDDGTVKMGQCEACFLPIDELRERVEKFAIVAPEELKKIDREKNLFEF